MENIKQTLLKGLLAVWCVGSLGTPILASSYVSWLGKHYGNIETSGSTKLPILIDSNTGVEIKPDTKFKNDVLDSKNFSINVVLGPFAIIYSIYYMGASTYYLVAGK
jgi:hypothetical protein